jgi:hypothetical protein
VLQDSVPAYVLEERVPCVNSLPKLFQPTSPSVETQGTSRIGTSYDAVRATVSLRAVRPPLFPIFFQRQSRCIPGWKDVVAIASRTLKLTEKSKRMAPPPRPDAPSGNDALRPE